MNITQTFRAFIALLMLCGTFGTAHAAGSLEVIQLKHRSAEDVIPLLRPFLDEQGALSGTAYQLIVRTSPENLEQLRDILKRVDTAPRQLVITVKQSADGASDNSELSVGARVRSQSGVSVYAPDRGQGGASVEYGNANARVRTRVLSTASRSADAGTQQIQVLEGHQALIQIGQSVPMSDSSVTIVGDVPVVQSQTEYQDVMRGFYVLPRINGDQVTLDVSPYQDKLSQTQGGAIDVQRMNTTVSGRLGEWIEVGGTVQEEQHNGSGYTHTTRTGSRDQSRVLLKVEEIQE